ncbi:MAG: tyrosine-type recombinase/integrase [Anaerolineae bacterium]
MARGNVSKRGDAWTIRVELSLDPVTGKRRQRRETVATKKEADRRLAELLVLADQGRLGASPKMTVAGYLERWLADYASTRSPKTLYTYTSMVNRYVLPALGTVPLGKLTTARLVRFFSAMRDLPRGDGKAGALSPSTIHCCYRMMHTALSTAVKWQLLTRSPMDGVEAPRVPRKEMQSFSVEQARAFLAAAADEGTKWQALFATLLHTGCRPGELKAATWADLDFTAGTLHICRHVQRLSGQGFVVGDTKTAGSRRTLALGSDVLALLRHHRAEQAAERLQLGSAWANLDLIFPSETGGYLEESRVHRVFARVCERAGVPAIRVYDLRHSSASLLLANGVDLKTVSARLGHANATLVLTTYGHVLPGAQAAASQTLETLLREAK